MSLTPLGYELLMASDGEQALASYRANKPEIIILDIMMPGELSGLDVCRKIRQEDGDASKIIFLSALAQAEDIAIGLAAGGNAYVTKPFSPMALIREIHKLAKHD